MLLLLLALRVYNPLFAEWKTILCPWRYMKKYEKLAWYISKSLLNKFYFDNVTNRLIMVYSKMPRHTVNRCCFRYKGIIFVLLIYFLIAKNTLISKLRRDLSLFTKHISSFRNWDSLVLNAKIFLLWWNQNCPL